MSFRYMKFKHLIWNAALCGAIVGVLQSQESNRPSRCFQAEQPKMSLSYCKLDSDLIEVRVMGDVKFKNICQQSIVLENRDISPTGCSFSDSNGHDLSELEFHTTGETIGEAMRVEPSKSLRVRSVCPLEVGTSEIARTRFRTLFSPGTKYIVGFRFRPSIFTSNVSVAVRAKEERNDFKALAQFTINFPSHMDDCQVSPPPEPGP